MDSAPTLQLRIEDPSGQTRSIPLPATFDRPWAVGRDPACDVPLRDASVPPLWADLRIDGSSGYWLTVRGEHVGSAFRLADLAAREASLPLGIPLCIGDTRLALVSTEAEPELPEFPRGYRAWLTHSESGKRALWLAKRSARTPLSVYLAGETGTGKEVMAQLIHAWSDRAGGPFVPLNCGALSLGLAESELFGHVKGAFTGAQSPRSGALLQAHHGTLFLDEIGDLPPELQVKLLRFLENGEIRPVGADRSAHADVRLLCATHRPLLKLVEEGKFRRDLYYRLASVTIEIPSLRERPEDIAYLSLRFAQDLGRSLSERAILRLQAHAWPGNVRELRHAVERACGLSSPFEPILGEDAFSFLLTPDHVAAAPELGLGTSALTLQEIERLALLRALRLADGHRGRAADILGVARSTLFEMLKRHRVVGPRSPLALRGVCPR